MPRHSETRILPYSCEQIYALVKDVESYDQFLPWCSKSSVHTRNDDWFDASLVVGYKIFRETFYSRVHYQDSDFIRVEYKRGPMKNLQNEWRFTTADNGHCKVHFMVAFEFSNPLLQGIINAFFHEAFGRMVGAFEARARQLYG